MLVVNPNNRIRSDLSAVETPLWAGLCADYNHADILDAEALDLTLEQTEEIIRMRNPTSVLIVVMGNNPSVSSTPKMPVAEALADELKGIDVMMTGIHPIAVNYQKYPVIHEPFKGFPKMPYGRLPMDKYRAHNWHCLDGSPRSPYASTYTSLNCPENCYFCNIHVLYPEHKVYFRPIEDVVDEIATLVDMKVRNIKFWDELFALKEDRVMSICSMLKGADLNIWAYARVDTVTKKMLKAMKAGGINWLAYGFESADISIRKQSGKKFKDSQAEMAIKMTRDAGINIIANFMFGLPGDTPESMKMTLQFAREHLFEFANFYQALPYPGSRWYEDVKPSMTPKEFDQYGKNRMAFRDFAFNDYFTNPAYLESIKRKFGQQGVNQIKEMLSWSL